LQEIAVRRYLNLLRHTAVRYNFERFPYMQNGMSDHCQILHTKGHPTEKDQLADLMCHTTQTASKCYRLVQKQQNSVTASRLLTNIMKISNKTEISTTQMPAVPEAVVGDEPVHVTEEVGETRSESESSDIVCPSSKFSSRLLFANSEAKIIRECCQEIIKSGPISQRRIVDALSQHDDVLRKFSIAQLISRVKYERRMFRNVIPKHFV
jgi:hypothetical protein